jgi:hypothetical protein
MPPSDPSLPAPPNPPPPALGYGVSSPSGRLRALGDEQTKAKCPPAAGSREGGGGVRCCLGRSVVLEPTRRDAARPPPLVLVWVWVWAGPAPCAISGHRSAYKGDTPVA